MDDFIQRNQFTMLRSVWDSLMAHDAETCKKLLGMIGRYAMDGKIPDEPGAAYATFLGIRPTLDYQQEKAKAGKRGGEAKQRNLVEAAMRKQAETPSIEVAERSTNVAEAINEETNDNQNLPKGKSKNIKDKSKREKEDKEKEKSEAPQYQYAEVISYLNEKTGKHFLDKSRDSRTLIKARFDDGFTLDDFRTVIDNMTAKWKGDPKMDDYLRPSTLFRPGNFESYLNARVILEKKKWQPEHQREYNGNELERMLLNAGKENR